MVERVFLQPSAQQELEAKSHGFCVMPYLAALLLLLRGDQETGLWDARGFMAFGMLTGPVSDRALGKDLVNLGIQNHGFLVQVPTSKEESVAEFFMLVAFPAAVQERREIYIDHLCALIGREGGFHWALLVPSSARTYDSPKLLGSCSGM